MVPQDETENGLNLEDVRAKRDQQLAAEFESRRHERGIAAALATKYNVDRTHVYRIVRKLKGAA